MLEHHQKLPQPTGKKEVDSSHATVVIGTLLGKCVDKIIDISNCFPMNLKKVPKTKKTEGEDEIEKTF